LGRTSILITGRCVSSSGRFRTHLKWRSTSGTTSVLMIPQ